MRNKVNKILGILDGLYNEAQCTLKYDDPFQLLIATQLAAQCTDERVNIVSKPLFKKYKSVYDFAKADIKELEKDIKPTGFFRNKSKNIINCSKTLIDEYNGVVPNRMEDLLKLSGVGRKTANLVLGDIFNIPGIVVDTHAKRVSYRLGFTKNVVADKVEKDLMKVIPRNSWSKFGHQLVYHGRAVCKARKPKCDECELKDLCEYWINLKEA
ncbi:MAG: endonuclease III [Clostridiales bacterium]